MLSRLELAASLRRDERHYRINLKHFLSIKESLSQEDQSAFLSKLKAMKEKIDKNFILTKKYLKKKKKRE